MRTRAASPHKVRTSLVAALLVTAVVVSALPAAAESGTLGASGFAVHDDETVYVVADATGVPRDVVIVDWLRIEGDGTVTLEDPGEVTAVEPLEDDVEPVLTEAGVEWTLDVEGRRDFFYRADTGRELPVVVEAVYYLDGLRVEPSELAGSTGRVRIEVTVTNRLSVTESVDYLDADGLTRTEEVEYWVPMLAPVKIDVDGTRFRNIIGDAEIMTITGSTVSHTFMAFPQPSETISIEMDGVDIAIEPIVVSVFPKMAGSPDFSIADDLAELRDGLDGLARLSRGHREVLGAVAGGIDPAEFAAVSGVGAQFGQLRRGTDDLAQGAEGLAALLDGQISYLDGLIGNLQAQEFGTVAQMPAALSELAAGVAAIKDGADGLVALIDGQIIYLDAIRAANAEIEVRASELASASPDATTTALAAGVSMQGRMLSALRDGDPAMGMEYGLADTRDGLQGVSDGLAPLIGSLESLAAGAAPLAGLPGQFDALAAALITLRDGGMVQGRQLPGLTSARSGLGDVASGIDQVGDGIGTAADALAPLEELPGMLDRLRETLFAIRDGGQVEGSELPGISRTVEGLTAMSDGLAEGIDESSLGEVVVGLMERAAEEFDTFLGKPEGATGDVRFIFKLDGIVAEVADDE